MNIERKEETEYGMQTLEEYRGSILSELSQMLTDNGATDEEIIESTQQIMEADTFEKMWAAVDGIVCG